MIDNAANAYDESKNKATADATEFIKNNGTTKTSFNLYNLAVIKYRDELTEIIKLNKVVQEKRQLYYKAIYSDSTIKKESKQKFDIEEKEKL